MKAAIVGDPDSPYRDRLVNILTGVGMEVIKNYPDADFVFVLPFSKSVRVGAIVDFAKDLGKLVVDSTSWFEDFDLEDTTGIFEGDEEVIEDEEDILEEALRLTTGPRINAYGPPTQDFRRTAGMLNIIFENKLKEGAQFLPHEIALIVNCIKLSRLSWSPEKRDSWVDTAGYARCGWICVQEEMDLGEL